MKLFKKRKLLPYIIGYHEKGILVENVGTSQEKIFYIKSEATQEPSEHRKIKLKREVNKRCNISLVECLTSRIFQKLGIDAVSYHLGKVVSTLFPNRWVNVSYSESFVSNNEHQIPLDSFYKFKCFKSKNKLASTPKELIEGQRVAAYKEITEKFPPRTYVDEDGEVTDVTGYSPEIGYAFDQYANNPVHEKLVDITDNEKTGPDALVNILIVDLSKKVSSGTGYVARLRTYSVIPDTEGDSTDAYTYSGTFRKNSGFTVGTAVLSENDTIATFTPDEAE